jgi:5,10-methylene-tetrahydrofolate dehydrogenase/methenyl tetrahydrofolate cyclohydrolase
MIADGKLVASKLKQRIIDYLKDKPKKEVCFVIFGNDPASEQFIGMKCRFAESLGIPTRVVEHPESLSFDEIKKANMVFEFGKKEKPGHLEKQNNKQFKNKNKKK